MKDLTYYFQHMDEFPVKELFEDVQFPHELLAAIKPLLKKMLVEPDAREFHGIANSEDISFYGNYYIGEGTVIYNDVTIIGPVYIGKNCEIMPGAIIRPNTIIGDNCNVGHGSEVKHCVMMNGSKVASLSFAGDSVLGKSARVGSGVIAANRKFNQSNATVKIDGEKIDLGTDFFGVIMGDFSRLGANSVTQPGTHIGPYTWVYPMTNVRGFIPAQKRVYHEREVVMEDNEIVELKP